MIKIFRTIDGNVHQISEAQEGSWIALIDPTATELLEIAERYQVDVDDLRAPRMRRRDPVSKWRTTIP